LAKAKVLFATCEDFFSADFKSVGAPVIFTFGVFADGASVDAFGFSVATVPSDEDLRRVRRPFSEAGVSLASFLSLFAFSAKCTEVGVPPLVGG